MTTQEANDRALDATKLRNAKGSEFEVVHTEPDFLDGSLVFVQFYDEDDDDDENYVYVTESDAKVMSEYKDVASLVANHQPATAGHRIVRELLHVGGVAGFIGILITLTICYMLGMKGATEVPQVLSGALTTILGFYFGSKVAKK